MSRTTKFCLFFLASATLALAAGLVLEAQDGKPAAPASPFVFPAPPAAANSKEGALRAAPLELTSSEGAGLRLVALDARAVLEPPLAFTELHLTFENPRTGCAKAASASPCRRGRRSAASR